MEFKSGNIIELKAPIEHEHRMQLYFNEMAKLSELYPCTVCCKVKYLVKETGIEKACESDCEHIKKYNETVKEYQKMFISVLDSDK